MAKPEKIHKAIQAERKKQEQAAKVAGEKAVTIAPGDPLHIYVVQDGEELGHYVLRMAESGQPIVHEAPPPAAPVSDPDPISDKRHMARTK